MEKLQSIEEEEEEEETKGELTGKAHSAGRTRTRDDYLQITPRAKHHQQHCSREGVGRETAQSEGAGGEETYREIIMMSSVLPPSPQGLGSEEEVGNGRFQSLES